MVGGQKREHADAPHPLALLRTRGERPRGRRAAEKRYELSSSALPPPRLSVQAIAYRLNEWAEGAANVRFGSKADMCTARGHVC